MCTFVRTQQVIGDDAHVRDEGLWSTNPAAQTPSIPVLLEVLACGDQVQVDIRRGGG